MANMEKVTSKLNDLRQFADTEIHPIVSPDNWGVYSKLCDLIDLTTADILAMLKEQEPRVLTLDEAVDGNYCYYVEFQYHLDCGWVKCDFDKMYLNGEVAMLFLRDKTFYQQREHYGKLWRLWDKRPTYEQKMAVKWE